MAKSRRISVPMAHGKNLPLSKNYRREAEVILERVKGDSPTREGAPITVAKVVSDAMSRTRINHVVPEVTVKVQSAADLDEMRAKGTVVIPNDHQTGGPAATPLVYSFIDEEAETSSKVTEREVLRGAPDYTYKSIALPDLDDSQNMTEIKACIDKVESYLGDSSTSWLYGSNSYLEGARPIDVLEDEGPEEVYEALEMIRG